MTRNLEPQLKVLIINHLIAKGLIDKNDTLINEFNIGDFSRRVDLALIKENGIFAYEIKSDGDTLLRLKDQVDKYLEYFDKVTVITTPRHTQKALLLIPNNVALLELDDKTNDVRVIKKGKFIKAADKLSMIQLMTMKDLIRVAKENKIIISNKRTDLEKKILLLPKNKLRQYTILSLKKRFEKVNILNEEAITSNLFKKQIPTNTRNETNIASQLDVLIANLHKLENELNHQSIHSSSVLKSDTSSK
ncbi:sce7726 family protein [Acinetobacter radioresistens]|uniref:sce7726 family protein n=1 Tax=Acinetobacter TaxID=469 RepID=UPI0025857CA3|nr:sce7726 family protein [uncultured Acinetobacter sp.]